jgi:hypothetical protein
MRARFTSPILVGAIFCAVDAAAQRPADRHPDLQGFWTNATATPLQRPAEFKDKPFLTEAEAAAYEKSGLDRLIASLPEEDRLGADLNDIYLETSSMKLVDQRRTSLVVDPPDGRLPPLLPQAEKRAAARKRSYDDPETLPLPERCLLGTTNGASQLAAPIVPNTLALNYYQIVQTPQHVAIYTEVNHDVRIIRIGGQHPPSTVQFWLGDSIGRWDGDTLVVDTTNFTDKSHFRGSGERMHVVERFSRTDARTIQYRVTVDDPDTWDRSWTADIPFTASNTPVVEYACHEGNYSLELALRGHRAEEREKK